MQVRHRLLPAVLVVAALLAALIAGCGGGSEKNAKAELKKGFSTSIPSANVTLDMTVKVDGVQQLSQPIRVKLSGPFKSNGPKKLPSLNWDVSVSGGGQTFSAGLVSTGAEAFVNFQGTDYKVDPRTMAQLQQAAAQGSSTSGGSRSLKQFGVDAMSWLKNPSDEGDSTVAGVTTKHVSGAIDVAKLFSDLNKVVSKAGGQVGAVRPQQLTPQMIDQIKKVVKDPKFDIYVGKSDNRIRRAQLSMDFTVPASAQSTARGVKGGNLTMSIEFAGVGEPQTITAPANSKPLSELTQQLGGLSGGLGGLGGAGVPGAGGTGGTGVTPGGSTGGSTGGTPSTQQFQKYAKCLEKASPSDQAALGRCKQLLK